MICLQGGELEVMEKMVRFCVSKMINESIIEKQQCAVITYGLDLFFSALINILSILLTGVIIKRVGAILLLLAVSIPLQSFGGGYHCNTHFRCWILTTGGYLVALFGAVHLPIESLLCVALASAYPLLHLSPAENPKAPFGEKFKEKMKQIVQITYFCGIVISLVLWVLDSEVAKFIYAGIAMEGISVLCAECKYKKELWYLRQSERID